MNFDDCRHLPELFEWGMARVVAELKPERAFIACRQRGCEAATYPTPYAVHGFSLANLYTHEDISTGVIKDTLRGDEGRIEVDAISNPELSLHTSVVLSGLRSILTTPLRHPSGLNLGLIYTDNRVKAGAFKKPHLDLVNDLAAQMVAPLGQIEKRERQAPSEILCQEPFEETRARAVALFKQGALEDSLSLLEEWVQGKEEDEEVGVAHGIRGRILEQSGQLERAVEALSKSVWLIGSRATSPDENYGLMLNNLAGVHVTLGNTQRALGLLTASSENWRGLKLPGERQEAGLAAASYDLGSIYLKLGNEEEAAKHLDRALTASGKAFGANHPRTEKIRQSLSQAKA